MTQIKISIVHNKITGQTESKFDGGTHIEYLGILARAKDGVNRAADAIIVSPKKKKK